MIWPHVVGHIIIRILHPPENFIEIRSVFLQSETNIFGTGQKTRRTEAATYKAKNIMPPVQHSLRRYKKHKTLYFTHLSRNPDGLICTKVGLRGPLADVTNCAKFYCNRFRVFDSVWGRNPIDLVCHINTMLALSRSV